MANIEINNLGPAGSELFNDSESFLNELNDQDMGDVQGGVVGGLSASLPTVDVVSGLIGGLPTVGALSITAPAP